MKLKQLKNLDEALKNEIEFSDDSPTEPLPDLILSKVKRKVRDGAKDYGTTWDNAIDLVDWAFQELNLSRPLAAHPRWKQYTELVKEAVKELHKARGDNPMWRVKV